MSVRELDREKCSWIKLAQDLSSCGISDVESSRVVSKQSYLILVQKFNY